MGRSKDGIRLKIDVTPLWWKAQAEDPESFAKWCVKAIRAILTTWPRAEVRLSREKVVAVVSFDGETRAGLVKADKDSLREALDQISDPGEDELNHVTYGQDERGRT